MTEKQSKSRAEKPLYTISAIARMLNVHQQTLRLYEKRGLLKPSRSQGNTRLYCDEDVDRIRMIIRLSEEFGVNLNGIEIILRMREALEQLQSERQKIEELLLELLKCIWDIDKETVSTALVRSSIAQIVRYGDSLKKVQTLDTSLSE